MEWLTALLVWLSGTPGSVDYERPRAAAAVEVAYCSLAREASKFSEVLVEPGGEAVEKNTGGVGAECATGTCPVPVRKQPRR